MSVVAQTKKEVKYNMNIRIKNVVDLSKIKDRSRGKILSAEYYSGDGSLVFRYENGTRVVSEPKTSREKEYCEENGVEVKNKKYYVS